MVDDEAQLFTIEGVAAAVLILTTVYLVISSTSVLTPAETHIDDMQLEQLGNDVLAVMDQPLTWNTTDSSYPKSPLETYIEYNQPDSFRETFLFYGNQTTSTRMDNLQFNARIYFRNNTGSKIDSKFFSSSSGNDSNYNRENAVKVTRWVNIKDGSAFGGENRNQTVLVEVLLWRN